MKSVGAVAVALAAGSVLGSSVALADYVPVIGGPTLDATRTGLSGGTAQSFVKANGFRADDAFLTGNGYQLINGSFIGYQPMAWGANGIVALQTLGQAANGAISGSVTGRAADGTLFGYAEKFTNGLSVGVRPVRWTSTGQISEMAYPGAANTSGVGYVNAVNPSGISVGVNQLLAQDSSNFPIVVSENPVRWNASGTIATSLGTLGADANGNTFAYAQAISGSGIAVGTATRYTNHTAGRTQAVRWDPASNLAVELITPTSATAVFTQSAASDINANGTVVVGKVDVVSTSGSVVSTTGARWNAATNTGIVL
ncbi:MAG: hypothetical protein JWM57_100, partial [Phycisphaerales bacterium]|nr:hypothetical protein [Phycisphaerales bacterium]